MPIRVRHMALAMLPGLIATESGAAENSEVPARVRVVKLLGEVRANLRDSRYTHATLVNEKVGRYEFDCSGMAAWVLRRVAPKAHGAVLWRSKGSRPLARDYYSQIAAVPAGAPKNGWSRVERVSDTRPGDVIAWLRPKEVRSTNTGHVAFVVDAPRPTAEVPHGYLLRIADASQYQHEDDTRAETGKTGFGMGTILVVADPETDTPVAYGWVGVRSAWLLETRIAIGRVER